MKAQALLDVFRQRTFDLREPYLWSDAEIYAYLDQAQVDFVRLSGGIRDARSVLTTAYAGAGETFLDLDPKILKLVSARRSADHKPVEIVSLAHPLAQREPRSGQLQALVLGEDDGAARCVDIPEAECELQLVIRRLPLATVSRGTDTLEVLEHQARWLLPGLLALAYRKDDADAGDEAAATRYQAEFERFAGLAFLENQKRSGAARSVAYGGI